MATEYVRVYKFARQNNYAGPRKVAWTKFAVSGDTDKTVGQITGMRYSHYHTSNDALCAGGSRWRTARSS